jgi:hypothetical protein
MKSTLAVVDPGRELSWTGASMGFKVVHRHLLNAHPGLDPLWQTGFLS